MTDQASNNSRQVFSVSDAGYIVYMSALHRAVDSAWQILEKIGTDIGESDPLPLQFHLAIFYLAVGAKAIMATPNVEENFKYRILDHSVESYFKGLQESSANPKNAVDAERFIKDPEERQLFLDKIRGLPSPTLQNANRLPFTPLFQIASQIFDKRMREYQDLWNSDWQKRSSPNFFPLLPGRVFQHWTGKDRWSGDMLLFSPILWAMELAYYNSLYDQFGEIDISPQDRSDT